MKIRYGHPNQTLAEHLLRAPPAIVRPGEGMLPFQHAPSVRWKEGCTRTAKLPTHHRRQFFFSAFLLLFLIESGSAQSSEDLFNGSFLEELRLYVHPDDWSQLRVHYL